MGPGAMIDEKNAHHLAPPGAAAPAGSPSRQHRVLIAYTAMWLMQARLGCGSEDRLGGKLVLSLGFADAEAEAALGATLAGAAFLGIEFEQEPIKRAMRLGCCDFMVNNLDEALRILKNEVRKRQPVSVGLHADVDDVLAEMIERGVQPDLLIQTMSHARTEAARESFERLRLSGSIQLDFKAADAASKIVDSIDVEKLVEEWSRANALGAVAWEVRGGDSQPLKKLDAAALRLLPEKDQMRRRWLELAPKYFRRDDPLKREIWLSTAEQDRLLREMSEEQTTD